MESEVGTAQIILKTRKVSGMEGKLTNVAEKPTSSTASTTYTIQISLRKH
jgi:hypothetical protein